MTVYQVSGPTITLAGDGNTNVDDILVTDVSNPITGAGGPVIVKITNTSTTDTATVGWIPSTTTYTYTGLVGIASALGTNQEFTVVVSSAGYAVTMTNPGTGFLASETVTIAGTALGGATPANDLVITVDTANPVNVVTALDDTTLVPGSGYSDATAVATTTLGAGTGLTVDITTTAGAVDTVTINQGGIDYTVGDVITITGGNADATIEVLTVNPGGEILTFTPVGTELWPQTVPSANSTVISPLSSDFVQINGQQGVDTTVTGNCASGDMYITPVNVVM